LLLHRVTAAYQLRLKEENDELKQQKECSICTEALKSVVFQCGHQVSIDFMRVAATGPLPPLLWT
jgi:hypothetical protein